jgi:hypothetical protein
MPELSTYPIRSATYQGHYAHVQEMVQKAEDFVSIPGDWRNPNASEMRVRDSADEDYLQWLSSALLQWKYEIGWLSSNVMDRPSAVLRPRIQPTTNANVHKCKQI